MQEVLISSAKSLLTFVFTTLISFGWQSFVSFFVVLLIIKYHYSFWGRNQAKKTSLQQANNEVPIKFTGRTINCVNPATGELLGVDNGATAEEVETCIKNAQIAQKKWRETSFDERRAFLHDLMDVIVVNQDEIARASSVDTGKTIFEAKMGEIMVSCEKIRYTIRTAEDYLKPEQRGVPYFLQMGGKKCWVEYHPIGVIGAIVPWNYPFHNFVSPVITSLFAGNACVVKGSEMACWSRRYFEKLVQDVLIKRGHDPNLVQLIPGYGDVGAAIVSSKGVGKILFIGSPQTGQKVMSGCVATLKPLILELGGKDPFVVLKPANVSLSVDRALNASFFNLGQNCISGERVLVQRDLFPEFSELLVERLATMRQCNPTQSCADFGSMTALMQLEKVEDLLADAVKKGAKILAGGKRLEGQGNGFFFQPTIITNLTPEMTIWTEEAFGPVMLLIPFDEEDDAARIANSIPFGLGSSIHCSDISRAERFSKKIESGMAVINDYGLSYLMQDLPFGGVKDSGFGHFNGPEGIRGFCQIKSIVSERWTPPPSSALPRFMKRPLLDIAEPLVSELMVVFYGYGLLTKINALKNSVLLMLLGKK